MIRNVISILLLYFAGTAFSQPIYFPPTIGENWDTISPQRLNWCDEKMDMLNQYLETEKTKAFILLIDGKIVMEKYYGNHTRTTPWYWASAGKTITAFMTGMAQQENYLSISHPTSTYLGKGWTSAAPDQEDKITIWHQLTMTSGLDDGVPDNSCTLDTCLIYKADAGNRWSYHNAPYTLLDKVIENATGTTLNQYTTQKLKIPTGMTGQFVMVGNNNVYFSNARSMARFGLLILNGGNWNGVQLMTDAQYFQQMVTTSQSLNESYGYLWWLNGKSTFMVPGLDFALNGPLFPHAPADMFAALGLYGQILNVVPSRNMVLIRMGESPENLPVPFLLNDKIWEYLNDMECDQTFLDEFVDRESEVSVFPNPLKGDLIIHSKAEISSIEVFDLHGRLIKTLVTSGNEKRVLMKTGELNPGVYYLRIHLKGGNLMVRKVIK